MAMQSGNVVITDKMQFATNVGGGGEVLHRQQWFPDERDGFITWLRGEFAAANAIIDSLCQHLRVIGEPGDYDFVFSCIQQRRCNWNPVLHMQQYFSVAEVMLALQQAQWRIQQRHFDHMKVTEREFKKPSSFGGATRQGYRSGNVKENHRVDVNVTVQSVKPDSDKTEVKPENIEDFKQGEKVDSSEEKGSAIGAEKEGNDGMTSSHVDSNSNGSTNSEGMRNENSEPMAVNGSCTNNSTGTCDALHKSEVDIIPNQDEKQKPTPIPKTFAATEIFDGKAVNVVEGLKLYEELYDSSKISMIVSLVNELRTTGRKGQLQAGQMFVVTKRPMKGRGREIIQLGLPIADAPPEDEHMGGTSKDRKAEAIPAMLQDVIDHLVSLQIMNVKPDSCIVDFFNEGDYSQPFMSPPWFGRPVCMLILTECDIAFGRVITIDHPGEYRGCLKLSLPAGSVLVMQGRSADFAKYAISSLRKPRILVTFTKSQPKKIMSNDSLRLSTSATRPSSPWGSPSSRPLNHVPHPAGPKHFGTIPATGVLPAPPIHPQHLPPPNGMQPLFVPTQVAPVVPYPGPVPLQPTSAGWAAVTTRHPPPRLPVPGTGVFLPPPGSGQPQPPQGAQQQTPANATEAKIAAERPSLENENGLDKSSIDGGCNGKLDAKVQLQECNGNVEAIDGGNVVGKEEQ